MAVDIEDVLVSATGTSNTSPSPDGEPPSSTPLIVYTYGRELQAKVRRFWDRLGPTQTSGGSANVQTLTYSPAALLYKQGQRYSAIIGFTNTGPATLNVNGLGAKSIFMDGAALAGGEMVAGTVVEWAYDGTQFHIISGRALPTYPGGFKNWLLNGDFDIWQRGAGGSASIAVAASTTAYTADRWYLITGANQACTVSQQTGLTNGSRYCLRLQRNSGQTGTGALILEQAFPTDMLVAMRGRIVTLSIKARSGANWSPTSGNLTASFYVGTGAEAKRGGGFTSETTVATVTTALGTSSSVRSITATSAAVVPTTTTQGSLTFSATPVGTAGTNDYVEIDEVQIEIGGLATGFDRRPFLDELTRCQRFFWKTFAYSTAPAQNTGSNSVTLVQFLASGVQHWNNTTPFPTRMRTAPTATLYNPAAANAQVRNAAVAADCTSSTVSVSDAGFAIRYTGPAGSSAGNTNVVDVSFDAEL